MLPVKAILFDIDGTLIDSNDAHTNAWFDAFQESGLNIEWAMIRAAMGMGGDHLLPSVANISKHSAEGKKLDQRQGEIYRAKYLSTVQAFPRARELVETLKAKGYAVAVVTSASPKDLRAAFKQTGLEGVFEMTTNAHDVDSSKPSPDMVLEALRVGDFDARSTIMIGDTPYDIEAALRAGVQTIAVESGGWKASELKSAWKVYRDPAALMDALSKSQLFSPKISLQASM